MDVPEALILAELSLRNLIRSVLSDGWQQTRGLPPVDKLRERQQAETDKRHGVMVSNDPLDYLYIGDLRNILNQHRPQFGEVFNDKPRFEQLVRILVDYRNTPFHARPLKWFESDLITGAAGWIVANITQWRRQQTETEDAYYPDILSVSDEWGNELAISRNMVQDVPTLGRLDVGQTVRFTCEGFDADGRELIWRIWTGYPEAFDQRPHDEQRGTSVELSWTPGKSDVSTATAVSVTLAADDDYPRAYWHYGPGWDAIASGSYAVLRPRPPKTSDSLL